MVKTFFLPMLLFFFTPQFSIAAESLDKVVAVVNEEIITESELNRDVEMFRQQMLKSGMERLSDNQIRKQVLQHLINMNLQLQLAKQNNITVDNTDLNDAISKIAASNRFSMTQLREAVSNQGISWDTYQENIRKELLISKLQQQALSKEINVTSDQVEAYLRTMPKEDQKSTYHLQNIAILFSEKPTKEELARAHQKADSLLKKIKSGEDMAYLVRTDSSSELSLEGGDLGERSLAELPEIFAKRVITMKVGEVAGPIQASNGLQLIKLIKVTGENPSIVKTHIRHILLKTDTSMTVAQVSKQADNIYHQIKSGKDFALMAKKYSLDTASAVKGGDLGWVLPGEVLPEVEEVMEKLALHKISKPVKSNLGWHIVEVLERKKMDDMQAIKRQQAWQILQRKKFNEVVQNWQQHLQANSYINIVNKELA